MQAIFRVFYMLVITLVIFAQPAEASTEAPKIVTFASGDLTLGGELFLPQGAGPFPVVLYNHGSAPKMWNSQASAMIAPLFVAKGWAFFMPYRRGQGLSEDQGPYIMDEIKAAKWSLSGSSAKTMVKLLQTDHLADQMAALGWLSQQDFVQPTRIVAMGNSFGGIEVLLGMAKGGYCAGVDASGGAASWQDAPELQTLMTSAVQKINQPVFFFQAENDHDLSPSKQLSAAMTKAGKVAQVKIYPPYGKSNKAGHSFAYKGAAVWFDDVYSFVNQYCPLQK